MKNILKTIIFITILSLSTALTSKSTYAGFGISPSDVINDKLKPGAHYEKTIIVSRSDPDEELKGSVDVDVEGAESWFTFNPGKEFLLPKGESRVPLTVIIDVPQDAPFNKFSGTIRIKASSNNEEKSGVSVVKGARVQVMLATTDIDVTNLVVRAVKIDDTNDYTKLPLVMNIENIGNMEASPTRATVAVEDLSGNPAGTFETSTFDKILPGQTKEITSYIKTTLAKGEYYGTVNIYLDDNLLVSQKDYFRVEETIIDNTTADTTPVVGTVKEGGKLPSFITNNIALLGLGLGVLLLVILLIIILSKRRNKVQSLTNENSNIQVKANNFLLVIIVVLVMITGGLFVLVYMTSNDKLTVKVISPVAKLKETEVKKLESENKLASNTLSRDETAADVMGVSTVKGLDEKPVLSVVGPQADGIYYVYESADLKSKVIYTANDGENLTVAENLNGWFKVTTNTGLIGYLPKESVKETR
jgi:hypothetical protein